MGRSADKSTALIAHLFEWTRRVKLRSTVSCNVPSSLCTPKWLAVMNGYGLVWVECAELLGKVRLPENCRSHRLFGFLAHFLPPSSSIGGMFGLDNGLLWWHKTGIHSLKVVYPPPKIYTAPSLITLTLSQKCQYDFPIHRQVRARNRARANVCQCIHAQQQFRVPVKLCDEWQPRYTYSYFASIKINWKRCCSILPIFVVHWRPNANGNYGKRFERHRAFSLALCAAGGVGWLCYGQVLCIACRA